MFWYQSNCLIFAAGTLGGYGFMYDIFIPFIPFFIVVTFLYILTQGIVIEKKQFFTGDFHVISQKMDKLYTNKVLKYTKIIITTRIIILIIYV